MHPAKVYKLPHIFSEAKNGINQKRKFERYDNHEPKEKIKNLLQEKKMLKTCEISKFLNRTTNTIREHRGNMQKEGLLIVSGEKGTKAWSLKSQNDE